MCYTFYLKKSNFKMLAQPSFKANNNDKLENISLILLKQKCTQCRPSLVAFLLFSNWSIDEFCIKLFNLHILNGC